MLRELSKHNMAEISHLKADNAKLSQDAEFKAK
jgi:hypothetical protein